MRLTQLQIDGFKSFPERAALVFDDGVTAIVGPNGCGKSNVIDAITWVLGEQSARSLRGERMEDVIFSGSDARRPTAAAEVKIQLSEITAALAGDRNGNGNGRRNGGRANGNGSAPVGSANQPAAAAGSANGRSAKQPAAAGSANGDSAKQPVSAGSANGDSAKQPAAAGSANGDSAKQPASAVTGDERTGTASPASAVTGDERTGTASPASAVTGDERTGTASPAAAVTGDERTGTESPAAAGNGRNGNGAAALAGSGDGRPGGGNGNGHAAVGEVRGGSNGGRAEAGGPIISRDIEVGRRLYRSGESEYLIDGNVCRLRDIQDLLMDLGVGVKAYAVIEQGRIAQMLGARPAERRQLLEEAAGITKYKTRRRTAELKLEAAQQNLTRVDDIVFEVEKQRTALKRQAAKARRYRRLRDELRRWQKVTFARRNRVLQQEIDKATRRLAEAAARERAAAAALAGVENTRERLRLELAECEQSVGAVRESAHRRELEIERCQQQMEFDGQRAAALVTAQAEGAAAVRDLEQRCTPITGDLAAARDAHAACLADRDAAAEETRNAERALVDAQRTIEGRESDVEAARSEMFAASNAASALQNVVDNAAAEHARLAESQSRIEAEAADAVVQAARMAKDRAATEDATRQARERLADVRTRLARHEAALASARAAREQATADWRNGQEDLAATNARRESLAELEAARAAYGDAAREVLTAAAGISHYGSVADHLEVDPADERAVEAGLGDVLQFVVVPSRADALAGVALAAAGNAGRCGFLIAGDAAPPAAPPVVPAGTGLQSMAEVVTVSGPGAAVVERLLRRRWLAPSIEQATAAAATIPDPIVTPEGVVVRGTDVVEGGRKSAAQGVLTARREINELEALTVSTRAAVDRLKAEVEKLDADAEREAAALEAARAEEHALEKHLVGLEMHQTRLAEEHSRLTSRQALFETERRHVDEERAGLEAKESEASESITRLEAEQRSADERFMQAQGRLLEARDGIASIGRRATEAQARQAALLERSGALAAGVRRLEEQIDDLRNRIDACKAENERSVAERQRLLEAVRSARQQRDADMEALDGLRAEITQIDEQVHGLRDEIAAREEGVRAARHELETARATVGQLEVARATAGAEATHLAEACQEALQADMADVCAEVDRIEADGPLEPDRLLLGTGPVVAEGGDDDATGAGPGSDGEVAGGEVTGVSLSGRPSTSRDAGGGGTAEGIDADDIVERLRERVERIGPVNMMAIDQFDELDARHEFLTAQRGDLLDSIAATGDAIKRIDATTRGRFREAFTAVNGHFQQTFEILFGGGRAGLVLLDESDVLESGIDIIAQPPGKRLQNIQLLSGGEKALTAMALMFAIFKYRPSPFCLLDEIDAPLDDANIGRFVEVLKGLQDRTQFVLVTHNRKTMEIADRLYGVTMEEPGVSKLISVNVA